MSSSGAAQAHLKDKLVDRAPSGFKLSVWEAAGFGAKYIGFLPLELAWGYEVPSLR